jgi:GTP cyclohydrolase FolE2
MAMDPRPSSSEPVDVQAAPPSVRMSLSRVGLTGVEKVIHKAVTRQTSMREWLEANDS